MDGMAQTGEQPTIQETQLGDPQEPHPTPGPVTVTLPLVLQYSHSPEEGLI